MLAVFGAAPDPARAAAWLRAMLLRLLAALALVALSVQAVDPDRILKSAQKYGPTAVANAKALQQAMASVAGKDDAAKIKAVNDFYNQRLAYVEDIDNWGQVDYWASPLESLGKGAGDCEDYAIAKYFALLAAGVPRPNLRLAYMRVLMGGTGDTWRSHMVVAYLPAAAAPGDELILDNLLDEIRDRKSVV